VDVNTNFERKDMPASDRPLATKKIIRKQTADVLSGSVAVFSSVQRPEAMTKMGECTYVVAYGGGFSRRFK
jgi:hypothetical protein